MAKDPNPPDEQNRSGNADRKDKGLTRESETPIQSVLASPSSSAPEEAAMPDTPPNLLRLIRGAVTAAVRKAREERSSISDPAWDVIRESTIEFVDYLVAESHRFRKAARSSVVTDANVRAAQGNLISRPRRDRAQLLTALGGVALGGALGGVISIVLVGQQPRAWVYLLLILLAIFGTIGTVWGIRND